MTTSSASTPEKPGSQGTSDDATHSARYSVRRSAHNLGKRSPAENLLCNAGGVLCCKLSFEHDSNTLTRYGVASPVFRPLRLPGKLAQQILRFDTSQLCTSKRADRARLRLCSFYGEEHLHNFADDQTATGRLPASVDNVDSLL